MKSKSHGLSCPRCSRRVPLSTFFRQDKPIHSFPAVRPCGACQTRLRLDMPRWCIWALILFIVLTVVVLVFGLDNSNRRHPDVYHNMEITRVAKGVALPVCLGVAAVMFRYMVRVTIATAEDITRFGGQ